jgi:hypothetical protein
MRARASVNREAGSSPALWIAAVQAVETAAAPALAVWTGVWVVQEETASGIEVSLLLQAAETAAPLAAALPVVQAAVPLDPAAAEALPASAAEEVDAAEEADGAAAVEGGK